MFNCRKPYLRRASWLLASLLCGTFIGWIPKPAAQTCGDTNFNGENLVRQALQSCNAGLLYEAASTVGERAVPALRELVDVETAPSANPHCGSLLAHAAGTALAKLGDEASFQKIAEEFKESGDAHARLQDLTLIGDDRAVAVMLTYLAAHPSLSRDVAVRSTQLLILQAIGEIGQRRPLPDVATARHHPVAHAGYGPGPPAGPPMN
jgi:hypothetical protein